MMPVTGWGRRRRALAQPFPDQWRRLLERTMAHWSMLDDAERERLETLIRLLLADKFWEASEGFELTDDIRVTVAGLASLLILGLDYDYYHRVTSIIVHPTTVVRERGLLTNEEGRFSGLALYEGPVVIAWDAARAQACHPERGHNVVYHEFAHKLDMLEGSADGTPPLETDAQYQRWSEVCAAEYQRLLDGTSGPLLDPYGGVNRGEFFAVVTEVFFDEPIDLERQKPDLYGVLRDFYRQDPAARERRLLGHWLGRPGGRPPDD
jgi:Mlc titration factor MtfA (ptsG expression regulator)